MTLSLKDRLFLATYRFRVLDPVPFAPLRRPLFEARVALVTTGGLTAEGQPPFDLEARGGDTSYRLLDAGVDTRSLAIGQRSHSFDHTGFEEDRNLGFPLDRLRELAAAGEVGSVAPRHVSVMGSITAPGRLIKESAPAAAMALVADGVDAALLVPL